MCTWRPLPPPCGPRSHRGGRFLAGSDGFHMTFGLENCEYLATLGVLENTAGSPTMWFLGSVLFSVLFGSVSSQDIQIKKNPGDDVTLMCEDPEYKKDITVLEWSREDSEILFVFRDGRPTPVDQHESFRNRVFLKDSQMKDGDLSVVLKNVTMNDTGTYQCRVLQTGTKRSILHSPPISTIHLSVVPQGDPSPGDPSPGDKGGLSPGGIIGIVLSVLVLVPVAVVLWIYRKKKGSNQSSSGSNNQQNPEQDGLNSDSDAVKNTTNPDPSL